MSGLFSKARWAGAKENEHKQADGDGESLTTILSTAEDRSALTILLADCSDVMRQEIVKLFEIDPATQSIDTVIEPPAEGESLVDVGAIAGVPEIEASDKAQEDLDARERTLAKRQKELSTAKVQETRTAALEYFDEWRANVIQRIGEVVNARDDESTNKVPNKSDKPETSATSKGLPELPPTDEDVHKAMHDRYPPCETSLRTLPVEKRALILHSVLLLLLSLEHYHAHSRVLLLHLVTSLDLPVNLLTHDENTTAQSLLTAAESMQADEETKQQAEANKGSRTWKVGLATVAGAALIGVTGGLAAPLLAAGLGSVMGGLGLGATAAAGYLGTLAGSSVLVGGLFGAYGGRMTGQMMDNYAREVQDFAFVPTRASPKSSTIKKEVRRLRVGVGISGWLTKKNEVVDPWKIIGSDIETFALQWELEALLSLGNSITTMVKSAAWGYAKVEIIKRTVFYSLMAGLWPLSLLKISRLVDNPFSIANTRAQKAGQVLADAIINRAQGERPVTLIGYSLGAKVIFSCLQRLAERKAFGLVESAVLIGAPASSTPTDWRLLKSVVAGRVVNVFSTNDYILAFLYRSYSIQLGVAGLQAVEFVNGVENVDVSDIVSGHTSYRFLTGTILKKIGFDDLDIAEVKKEAAALKKQEEQDEKARQESEHQDKTDAGSHHNEKVPSDQDVENLEREAAKRTEESLPALPPRPPKAANTQGVAGGEEKAPALPIRPKAD